MKLGTRCSKCKSKINFNKRVADRFVLAKKMSEELKLECEKCGSIKNYHVNDIKAEEDKRLAFLSLFVFIGGTTIILMNIWEYIFQLNYVYAIAGFLSILSIPFMIYQAINNSQENSIRYFNSKLFG